jgi:hypothetical protein
MPSAVADALLPAPVNPAQPPQGFWGNAGRFAYDALGLGDVAKALRGQMTANEAQDFAFGAAAGLLPIGRAIKPVTKGIRAYHGSPHDFDRFDMSKIGTGEGAQAYGHGLYFAENPQVADMYSRVVTKSMPSWSGTRPPAFDMIDQAQLAKIPDEMRGRLIASWQANGEDVAKNLARKMFEESRGKPYSDALHGLAHTGWKPPGHRYEVNINAHPDQFLDWDKPLSQQAQPIRAAIDPLIRQAEKSFPHMREYENLNDLWRGQEFYRAYSDHRSSPRPASNAIKAAGIPGIKYLDQGSRTAGDGSRNYVVFDDKLIDIIKKYGLAALGLPPAMTAGSQIWNSQTQQ